MKHQFFCRKALIILVLIVALIQAGCRENTLISSKVSPSANAINVFQYTFTNLITHTFYSDSAITSTNIGGVGIYQGVGSITDPYFGTMTGATYFQVLCTDFTPGFFVGDSVDSAVLILPYGGLTYGDSLNQSLTQTYQVFYLQDTMGLATTYYSNSTKPIDAVNPLSDPTTVNLYNIRDSFLLNILPANYSALRIRLKLPVLMPLLNNALNVLTNSINPVQDFLNAFNGICVRVADTRQFANAMPYFELDGTSTYSEASILVFYHPAGTVVDSDYVEPYYFNTGACAHFNSITRSYKSSPVNALYHSTAANDNIIALQNQPGASIDVIIPGLHNLPAGVINKAELQLTLLPAYNSIYSSNDTLVPPEKLTPLGIGMKNYPSGVGLGVPYEIADFYPLTSTSPLTVLDGYLHTNLPANPTLQVFTVDIPREVMASIAAKNDTIHLHITGTNDYYGAFHMVAGGGNYGVGTADSIYRAKLNVVYSKLTN